MSTFFDKVAELSRDGQRFAVATVVARRAPVSAHLGDRAIVFPDGRMEGFVGGACSREIVRRQALDALTTRNARLVSIRPDAVPSEAADPEHVFVPMTCASEGAIDVYVEPFGPARRLVIIGATPVADAVARSAVLLNFDVVRVVATEELRDLQSESRSSGIGIGALETLESLIEKAGQDAAVVVASQGHYDEESLEVVLKRSVSYVGLVASRKRGATVRAYLEARGVGAAALNAIRNPAGIDLGARTAPEVALSILAEIVQTRPVAAAVDMNLPPPATAVDPVCGMDVDVATARHTAEVEGTSYYFCCAQCRARFVADPHAFLHSRA